MTRLFAPIPPTDSEIAAIVRDQLGCDPHKLTELRGGAWSTVLDFDCDRGPMVIRFSATDDDFRCDQLAAQFTGAHLPIPQVFGIGQHEQHWWCISQRMPGSHLDDASADELTTLIPSLAEMLIAMREVDAGNTTGYGGWDADGNGVFGSFAEQLMDVAVDREEERGGGWLPRLRQHHNELAVFDRGLAELEQRCAIIPEVRQLIHQDTLNYNVMVQGDQVSGIFDWGCAMWGDALYDLAWFRFWEPWYPQWASVNLAGNLEQEVGMPGDHAPERIHAYLIHIGLMHIRYNALIENWTSMREVSDAMSRLLEVTA